MNTTYVLHGGATSTVSPGNDKFFSLFTSLTNKRQVNILMCYFAIEKESWDELLKRDKSKITKNSNKNIATTVPTTPNDLLKKIEDCDVLYVAGGKAELIEPLYRDLNGLEKRLKGKIYLGSSMGAFMISKHYVLSYDSQDSNRIHKGLGILSINTLAHWNQEKRKGDKIDLLKAKSNLPILTLDEGESVMFVK